MQRSRTARRWGLLAAALHLSCAITGVRVAGTLGGEPVRWTAASGIYCERCPNRTVVRVFFTGDAPAPEAWNMTLEIPADRWARQHPQQEFGYAPYAPEFSHYPVAGSWVHARSNVRRGRVTVQSLSPQQIRFRFWVEFDDGSRIEGAAEVPLRFSGGYE